MCDYKAEYCIYITKNEVLIHTAVQMNIGKIIPHDE